MLCDFCHEKEAVIFMEQHSLNGENKTIHICEECALDHGITPGSNPLGPAFEKLIKEIALVAKNIRTQDTKTCPVCGTRFSEIRKTASVGCPECYTIFKDELKVALKKTGVTEKYNGSMPARLANFKSVLTDRIILQNKLDKAIQVEDYEKAAMYRDYLKALETRAVFSGEDDGKS